MWLMTKHGFYSIVQKETNQFHVRARVRQDVENLVERVPLRGVKIHSSNVTDYPFRVIVAKEEMLKVLQYLGDTLDYTNFKNTVGSTPDQQNKHHAYHTVWQTMTDAFGGYGRTPSDRRTK